MKKQTKRIISVGLCAAMCLGCCTGTIYAVSRDKQENTEQQQPTVAAAVMGSDEEVSKDESVYVLAGADGSVKKIIVSDWLKNALGSADITDESGLSDIENVKGDETYSMNGDNMQVWDAEGNDIYYQGDIDKELPVGLTISYKLDGKSISADELAGKSGKVTIRFDYENRQYEMVSIDGKQEKIYVPFAMLTGMLLNDDVFTNVEVSGGKLINDGNHTAVIGIAFPGLQENLAIADDKLDIPDYVEITADVKNFEFGTTITVATNELFNKIDSENLDSIDDLSNSLNKLTDAMSQLMDGSSQLYDGLNTLLEKSGELVDGINKLSDGAKTLKDGAGDVDAGAGQLMNGISSLYSGLSTLSSNNSTLNGGAKTVFETLLSTANTQIAAAGLTVPQLTISNYSAVLSEVIASLDENAVYQQALNTVTQAVEANRPMIETQVTAAVREQVKAQVTAAVQEEVKAQVTEAVREQVAEQVIPVATEGQMTKDTYDAAVEAGMLDEETHAAIEAAIDAQLASEAVQNTINDKTAEQMASEAIVSTIEAKTEEQMQTQAVKDTIAANVELQVKKAISDNMASDEVQAQLTAASEGAKSIISLKTSLDSYNSFYLGLLAYTSGVADAASGAEKLNSGAANLKEGTAKLSAGASDLYNGILQLKDGAPALVDGITQLRDGSMQLSDGLKEFNEQGVQKLVDAVNGDLGGLLTRVKATIDVSKDYKNFSGLNSEMDGQVKFIYRTDSIKLEG